MHVKRIKLKKNKILNRVILIFILLSICIIYIFKIFNEKALPQFISYSEVQTKKIVGLIVNSAVTEEIANNINIDKLFITTKDSNGNISSIDFNSSEVNKLLAESSRAIEKNLLYLENGDIDKFKLYSSILSSYNKDLLRKGIIYELPSGIIFNNTILSNIFPKIPVKMSLIGNIFTKISTNIESYGINNALIKVNMNVEVEVKMLLPFVSENTKVNCTIPIIIKVIEGNIPSYYFNGYLSSPSLTTSINN